MHIVAPLGLQLVAWYVAWYLRKQVDKALGE